MERRHRSAPPKLQKSNGYNSVKRKAAVSANTSFKLLDQAGIIQNMEPVPLIPVETKNNTAPPKISID